MNKVLFEQKPEGQTYVVQLRDKNCDATYRHTGILEIKRIKGYILLASKDSMDFIPDNTMFTVSDGTEAAPRYTTEHSDEVDINDMVIETPEGEGSILDVMSALAPFMGETPQGE